MDENAVEWIYDGGKAVALLIRAEYRPEKSTFPTPSDLPQQLGFIVYRAGERIRAHVHVPIERRLVGTAEIILVRSGRAFVDLYNAKRELLATREMKKDDLLYVFDCGHGFRMCEDTVLLEIKQGPYTGLAEKECFGQ
jgi:hypothetical protein